MKSNSHDELDHHNLVMFPASKNFKIALSAMEMGPDPLHDLLNEYSHLKDEDLDSDHDEEKESEILSLQGDLDGNVFHSLEAFMSRNQIGDVQDPDDKLIKMINDRIDAITDAKNRMKFYLEEIEMFLPSRKR